MKKLAIFVEGQTEQLFVEKLLIEMAGQKNITINKLKSKISKKGNRSFKIIDASSATFNTIYYVLIYDSGNDDLVKSDILDNYNSLVRENYQKIIGLRDVYPKKFQDIIRLKQGLKYGVKTIPIPVNIVLAVMEIEAWFLAEVTHFLKIHSALTLERIITNLNFNPKTEDVETRDHPANDLNTIYKLERFAYTKKKSNCQRTVNALNYNELYLTLPQRVSSLNDFIKEVDSFLS